MDKISRLRTKNMLTSLLSYCDKMKTDQEKAILLRVCVVIVGKLRVHSNADPMLGCDVRDLLKKVDRCKDLTEFLDLWDEALGLVVSYKEEVSAQCVH